MWCPPWEAPFEQRLNVHERTQNRKASQVTQVLLEPDSPDGFLGDRQWF